MDSYTWPVTPGYGPPAEDRPLSPGAPPPEPSDYTIGGYHSVASVRGSLIWEANYEDPWWIARPIWDHDLHLIRSGGIFGSGPMPVHHYFILDVESFFGPNFTSGHFDPTESDVLLVRNIILPEWVPVILFATLTAVLFVPIWRQRRSAQRLKLGQCINCGYDLRAHRPGEKCPECGTPAAAPTLKPSPQPH